MHEDSPIGIVMKGEIDPLDNTNNKIATFLKIAGEYIPILETLNKSEQSLKYERVFRLTFAGLDVTVDVLVELLVGWRAENFGAQSEFYNVTYTPFAWGWLTTRLNGTSWLGAGTYSTDLEFVGAKAPIGVEISSHKLCFSGNYYLRPVTLVTQAVVALRECSQEIIDELINQHTIYWNCGFTEQSSFTHLNITFNEGSSNSLFDDSCITF